MGAVVYVLGILLCHYVMRLLGRKIQKGFFRRLSVFVIFMMGGGIPYYYVREGILDSSFDVLLWGFTTLFYFPLILSRVLSEEVK